MGDLHGIGGPARRALMLRAARTSVLLSLFFVVVYGGTNWFTAQRPTEEIRTWYFAWEPAVIRALHKGLGQSDAWSDYQRLTEPTFEQPATLRDLLEIVPSGPEVPLEEVEPWETIVTRFVCTAMSLGALSPEAHETLAVGMNRIGGRSNSGEGGKEVQCPLRPERSVQPAAPSR